jgi:chitinase
VAVTQYTVSVDGLGLGVVSVPHPQTTGTWSLGLRPNTAYTIAVQAWDARYNGSAVARVPVTTLADTTPPSTPSGLRVDAVAASKVLLTWNSGTDAIGPVVHEVLVNGVVTPNSFSTVTPGTFPRPPVQSAWVRQLEPGTAYQFAVRARDGSGNVSESSNTVSATTGAASDTVAPSTPTLIRADSIGSGTCPEEIWTQWTAATDDSASAAQLEYELRINGRINEVIPGGTFTVTYTEVLGANTVTIVAVDPAGNASPPSNAITAITNWGFGGCSG